jgi:hypothetical protein
MSLATATAWARDCVRPSARGLLAGPSRPRLRLVSQLFPVPGRRLAPPHLLVFPLSCRAARGPRRDRMIVSRRLLPARSLRNIAYCMALALALALALACRDREPRPLRRPISSSSAGGWGAGCWTDHGWPIDALLVSVGLGWVGSLGS